MADRGGTPVCVISSWVLAETSDARANGKSWSTLRLSPFSHTYHLADGLTSIRYPSQRVVRYEYNAAGQAAWVGKGETGTERYVKENIAYDAGSAVTEITFGNDVKETTVIDGRQRVASREATRGGSLWRLGLTYHMNGNVLSQEVRTAGGAAIFTQSYQYDDVDRLTRVDESASGIASGTWWGTFGYDTYGNRWVGGSFSQDLRAPTKQAHYDPVNNRIKYRLAGVGGADVAMPSDAYDAAGNLKNHPWMGELK